MLAESCACESQVPLWAGYPLKSEGLQQFSNLENEEIFLFFVSSR